MDYSTLLHQITTGRGKDIPIYQTTRQHIPEIHSFKCQKKKKLSAWPLPTRQDGAPHWLQTLTGRSTVIGSSLPFHLKMMADAATKMVYMFFSL